MGDSAGQLSSALCARKHGTMSVGMWQPVAAALRLHLLRLYDSVMDLSSVDPKFRTDLETAIRFLLSKGCSEVYVFGSLGAGTPHAGSDIDIAVRGIRPEEFFRIYGELLTRLRHDVDLVDLDLQADFGRVLAETGSLRRVA